MTDVRAAAWPSIRPLPTRFGDSAVPLHCGVADGSEWHLTGATAVFMMAALTSSGTLPLLAPVSDVCASVSHAGCAARTSAASPATCGVAIDVPLKLTPWLPVPNA